MNEKVTTITIVPFFLCNLKCSFCYNKNLSKVKTIIDFESGKLKQLVENQIDKSLTSNIVIKLYGGEIFMDGMKEDTYKKMFSFLSYIKNYCQLKQKKVSFHFISNLIHKETDRWIRLLSALQDVQLSVSVDLVNRFSSKTFEIFLSNFLKYKGFVRDILITATKSNVDYLMGKSKRNSVGEKVIRFLDHYKGDPDICINFTDYVPCKNFKDDEVVSNELRFEFYKFLVGSFPRCNLLEPLFMIARNQRVEGKTCSGKGFCIMPDLNIYPVCTTISTNNLYGKDLDFSEVNQKIKLSSYQKLGCLQCEYFKYCPSCCPASTVYMDKESKCYIKRIIEFLKEKSDE